MSEQNKKGNEQLEKRNPEADVSRLLLEASSGKYIDSLKLTDLSSTSKNKPVEGMKSKVFLVQTGKDYNFYLGAFDFDELSPPGPKESYINNSKCQVKKYQLSTGYVNWKNMWDKSKFKDNNSETNIVSSTPEINPFMNKLDAFKYSISTSLAPNTRIGPLKQAEVEILVKIICSNCNVEKQNDMVFCQNEGKFFCSLCDKGFHDQKEKSALSRHLRTNNFKYKLTYFGNCSQIGHFNKPYQYFDLKNKECLCTKCVEAINPPENIDKYIVYIEDYLQQKKNEEDFLNSEIDSAVREIDSRLNYAEKIWKTIDEYENKYCTEADDEKNLCIKKLNDEGFARETFLCCIFMEIQRLIKEIDSKIIFNKNQRNNVDVSTFLYMNHIYLNYMQKELITNLDRLCASNFEISAKPLINIGGEQKYKTIDLKSFEEDRKSDTNSDFVISDI